MATRVSILILTLALLLPASAALADVSLTGIVKTLGGDQPAAGHTLILLWDDGESWVRESVVTDQSGHYRATIPLAKPVRIYSTGQATVPASWSRVEVTHSGDSPAPTEHQHDIWLRPLGKVAVSGTVRLADGTPVHGAQVMLALLELLPGGEQLPVASPVALNTGRDGSYRAEVVAGVYDVWSHWTDRRPDAWVPHFGVHRGHEIYRPSEIDLIVREQPTVSGRVLDASKDNAPTSAHVSLFTHAYLNHVQMFASEEADIDGLPAGGFSEQLAAIDSNDFSVIVASADSLEIDAMLMLRDMNIAKLAEHGPLILRDPANGKLTVSVMTCDGAVPVDGQGVSIQPAGFIDAPSYLRGRIVLRADTDANGAATFWGLPSGRYAIFMPQNDWFLGEVDVTGDVQTHTTRLPVPHLRGKLTYPDGAAAQTAMALVSIQVDGEAVRRGGPIFSNRYLRERGEYFIPLHRLGLTYEITIAAPAPGGEMRWNDDPTTLPFVAKSFEVTPNSLEPIVRDAVLQPRPKE